MVREAIREDLNPVLRLHTQLYGATFAGRPENLERIWEEILSEPNYHIIVDEEEGKIVAFSAIIIVKDREEGHDPYALIESVVMDKRYRKMRLTAKCLNFAKEIAKKENCKDVIMLSGIHDEEAAALYKNSGQDDCKIIFVQWLLRG